jgi:DNA polymerase III gamma/tau subunit
MARTLNCKAQKSYRPCGDCVVCKSSLDRTVYYQEYDSAIVGSVESIRKLRDDFFVAIPQDSWRIVVFDEFHLASRTAQSALLKAIEEGLQDRMFVIFCTTDVEDILPTIRSRSIELMFDPVPTEEVVEGLRSIAAKQGIQYKDDHLDRIAKVSRGHMRNAVMALHMYSMVDNTDEYVETLKSSEHDLITALLAIREADRASFEVSLSRLCTQPLAVVKADFYDCMKNLLQYYAAAGNSFYDTEYRSLIESYGPEILNLFQHVMASWAANSFTSDSTFQALMWSIWMKFQKKQLAQSTLVDRSRVKGPMR